MTRGEPGPRDPCEGRQSRAHRLLKRTMENTQRLPPISTTLQRIAQQAASDPKMVFTSLAHLIDVPFLHEAYRRTRKDAASGVDRVTAGEYAGGLDRNLSDLHARLRSGRYRAPPVERVWIGKEDGKKRPIGIPTFEDKVVQRAVSMLLTAIYEGDFRDCSYGFRPGRSPHQAVKLLRERCWTLGITRIIDADISGFFDTIEHSHLLEFIKRRVNDGGLIRLIGKWLNAGVQEAGEVSYPEDGTPQGGVISPLLANIYLHYVLDEWFVREVQPRMKGNCFMIRFADDFVIGCTEAADADRIMGVLPKRFGRYGLTIHPEKTRVVSFGRPPRQATESGCGTFDFLGFTHYWTRSRGGNWCIKRRTSGKRQRRTKKAIWRWCRANRHKAVRDQHKGICAKLRGFFQYYGIRGNYEILQSVKHFTEKAWHYWLSRRSSDGAILWDKFREWLKVLSLPRPRIIHDV